MSSKLSQRILFWILLGAASTFFAEVISGSSPLVFFDPWGLLVVAPLYSLHILVLASLAFKNGAPRFSTLYFAGMLFGLYEAYITKVLWSPPWGASVNFLGIDLVAFGTLVPYWHNFFSFLIPLFIVETLATNSRTIFNALPRNVQKALAKPGWQYGLAAWMGIVQTAARNPGESFASGALNLLILAGLVLAWRWVSKRKFSLPELLPRGLSFYFLLGLLLLLYIWAIPSIFPEKIPVFADQLTILVLYLLIGLALFFSRRAPAKQEPNPVQFNLQPVGSLVLVYLAITFLAGLLPQGLKIIVFAINGYGGMAFGVATLIYSTFNLRTKQ
jgi:uncharacterized membrane protein SirB2